MSYFDEPGAPQAYAATAGLAAVDPGIDISHYGAPYKGMLGLGAAGTGMLYRYGAGLGVVQPWTGVPAQDPRMVKQFARVRATFQVQNVPSSRSAEVANRIKYQGQQLFPGMTVSKIGTTGWIEGGRVGYEVILSQDTRAGLIKSRNFEAGVRATRGLGGDARIMNPRTIIPQNAFRDAAPGAPSTPESMPSATPYQQAAAADENFFTRRVAGLPVWTIGLIGVGVLGAVGFVVFRPKKKAVATNRRRRRRSTRRRRRR